MKLLFIIDNLSTGGAQRQMVNLAVGLKQRGHEIKYFCYAPGDFLAESLRVADIPIIHFHKLSRYSLGVVSVLREFVRAEAFDLVLSYLPTPNLYILLATLGLRRRPRLVVSERNNDYPGGLAARHKLVRQLYRAADSVVVNSAFHSRFLANKYPWMRDKLKVIINGVDLTTFIYTGRAVASELKILVLSSVQPRKNGLCLVEAIANLREKHHLLPRVSWVGELVGKDEPDSYYFRMETKIKEAGLDEQWRWLGQRSDIPSLIASHDILVHPSYGEGLPNAVCEALACGRPVIASDVFDNGYLVENGVRGFLFDWQDAESLAAAILNFSRLPFEERAEMGRQGRIFAEKHLAMGQMVDNYEAEFWRLVDRR